MFSNFFGCINNCTSRLQPQQELVCTIDLKSPVKERFGVNQAEEEKIRSMKILKSPHKPSADSQRLFTDKEFPPQQSSLGSIPNFKKITWKRVNQFIKDPILFDYDPQNRQPISNSSSNSYFLATIEVLASYYESINRLDDLFSSTEISNKGFYTVRISNRGIIEEVLIDDYFPVYESSNQPVFAKPREGVEIWEMVFEKAWAKVKGSYYNMQYGLPSQVLSAFSQAPCFYLDVNSEQWGLLWMQMLEATQDAFPVVASSKKNNTLSSKIGSFRIYNILASYQLKTPDKLIGRVIKLMSTQGELFNGGEYSIDNRAFWDQISSNAKQQMGFNKAKDGGYFYLSFDEFKQHFDSISICHLRSTYNYNFEKVSSTSRSCFFEVDLETQGEVYFTLHSNSIKDVKNDFRVFGRMTILVARVNGDDYEYQISKLEVNFPNLTVRCPRLRRGKYIVYTKCNHRNQKNICIQVLSVYSEHKVSLVPIHKSQLKFFFQKVFFNHALSNSDKRYLKQNQDNWICSQLLYNQGSFAYIVARVKGSKKLKIQFDNKTFTQAGFKLKKPFNNTQKNIVEVTEERPCVIVCRIHQNPPKNLVFPPKIKILETI